MKLRLPDQTTVILENDTYELFDSLEFDGGYIEYKLNAGLEIKVKSTKQGIKFIKLRWNEAIKNDIKVLGAAWERGYGDLEW